MGLHTSMLLRLASITWLLGFAYDARSCSCFVDLLSGKRLVLWEARDPKPTERLFNIPQPNRTPPSALMPRGWLQQLMWLMQHVALPQSCCFGAPLGATTCAYRSWLHNGVWLLRTTWCSTVASVMVGGSALQREVRIRNEALMNATPESVFSKSM